MRVSLMSWRARPSGGGWGKGLGGICRVGALEVGPCHAARELAVMPACLHGPVEGDRLTVIRSPSLDIIQKGRAAMYELYIANKNYS